ncbi:MAG TPA: RimK family alpha-L-glutamate ligase [Balneolaceae bacterium]|nr:RimK family alpha-L-glutamate ligase [Balneolaceae bacterium]|tara:strand:+ start:81257 stop:83218 length:1962 start_codon:yes stop_codon:yes gene_type:complete
MQIQLRRSLLTDLDLLLNLEKDAFPIWQQSSRRVLRTSLRSAAQHVFIAECEMDGKLQPVGYFCVHLYKRTIRIYSIAVYTRYKQQGIGSQLLSYIFNYTRSKGYERVTLEADSFNSKLISWYQSFGFQIIDTLIDYYGEDMPAFRMELVIEENRIKKSVSYVVVVNDPDEWRLTTNNARLISATDYVSDHEAYSKQNLRVFNLCYSYKYQSMGYYVSLLANAREHKVIPSVATLRDTKDQRIIHALADDLKEWIQRTLLKVEEEHFQLNIYFGECRIPAMNKMAQKMFQLFELPFFTVHLVKNGEWRIHKIDALSLKKTPPQDFEFIQESTDKFLSQQRFHRAKMKNYEYDLAILVNTEEVNPPSDKNALQLFKKAANETGFYVEEINKKDQNRLSEFDALFIRETTNVNNYTYQFSRKAYAEGLVVIDDPWSVLKCSNKIYLHERLRNNGIPVPETFILYKSKKNDKRISSLTYPVILKQPDSAFSLGVLKVENESELKQELKKLFQISDLIVAQEFSPTDFDWRIGVLDNQPLFACKYYMSSGHWQIYNWNKEGDPSGESETIAISEVPKKVLSTALKAASLMGDGLYGVDLKEINGRIVVIEVNDNPNIDHGIEDLVEGFDLYLKVMRFIKTRIEMGRNIARFVSSDAG